MSSALHSTMSVYKHDDGELTPFVQLSVQDEESPRASNNFKRINKKSGTDEVSV